MARLAYVENKNLFRFCTILQNVFFMSVYTPQVLGTKITHPTLRFRWWVIFYAVLFHTYTARYGGRLVVLSVLPPSPVPYVELPEALPPEPDNCQVTL